MQNSVYIGKANLANLRNRGKDVSMENYTCSHHGCAHVAGAFSDRALLERKAVERSCLILPQQLLDRSQAEGRKLCASWVGTRLEAVNYEQSGSRPS